MKFVNEVLTADGDVIKRHYFIGDQEVSEAVFEAATQQPLDDRFANARAKVAAVPAGPQREALLAVLDALD